MPKRPERPWPIAHVGRYARRGMIFGLAVGALLSVVLFLAVRHAGILQGLPPANFYLAGILNAAYLLIGYAWLGSFLGLKLAQRRTWRELMAEAQYANRRTV